MRANYRYVLNTYLYRLHITSNEGPRRGGVNSTNRERSMAIGGRYTSHMAKLSDAKLEEKGAFLFFYSHNLARRRRKKVRESETGEDDALG